MLLPQIPNRRDTLACADHYQSGSKAKPRFRDGIVTRCDGTTWVFHEDCEFQNMHCQYNYDASKGVVDAQYVDGVPQDTNPYGGTDASCDLKGQSM